MELDWVPRFVAGGGFIDLTLDLPYIPFVPDSPTVGGSRISAAGIPASYIVREDEVLQVTFRVWETEYVAFLAMLRWGQQSEVIAFYPDANVDESFEVWLDSPAAGQRFAPQRDGEAPFLYLITCEFRRVDGLPWDLSFFAEAQP